jgi:DNA-binding transcriptional ArsR family regulator
LEWDDDDLADGLLEAEELQSVFSALANPVRRYLWELLEVDDASAGDLARSAATHFGISKARAAAHLQVLGRAGLVTVHPDGTWRYYRRVPGAAQDIADWLKRVELSR